MKKIQVMFIIGVVLFGVCCTQNANAQNANIVQRIIGTWTLMGNSYDNSNNGKTWVFSADGKLTRFNEARIYAVTDTKIAVADSSGSFSIYDVSISTDGKTLILTYYDGKGYWFTKK